MGITDVIKKSVLEGFSGGDMSTTEIMVILGITFIISLYIFYVYKLISKTALYDKSFHISMTLISVITAGIIVAMQSSIVISLGMVGALSIVRFRTAIKEPLDIAFLFWSIAVGIVLAAGMIPLAVFGSIIIGVVLLVFVNRKAHMVPYIVVLSCANAEAEKKAREFLQGQVQKCIVKSKTVQKGLVELNMEIRLKEDNTDFINALSDMEGVNSAVLVSYNGDFMG